MPAQDFNPGTLEVEARSSFEFEASSLYSKLQASHSHSESLSHNTTSKRLGRAMVKTVPALLSECFQFFLYRQGTGIKKKKKKKQFTKDHV